MYYDSATTASPSNGRNPFGERVEKASKRHCLYSVDFFALMCSVVLIRYLVLLEACGDAVCCPVLGGFQGSPCGSRLSENFWNYFVRLLPSWGKVATFAAVFRGG